METSHNDWPEPFIPDDGRVELPPRITEEPMPLWLWFLCLGLTVGAEWVFVAAIKHFGWWQ
jgi:hypothetical protein